MGGLFGGSSPTVQSTQQQSSNQQSSGTFAPHSAAAPGYGMVAGQMQNLMQRPVPFFPGQTYVGPSQATQWAVNQGMNQAQTMMPAVNQAALGIMGRHANAGDIANNPQVQAYNQALMGQANRNLFETQLPQVNAGANQARAMGSGRHGLMQGTAVGKTNQGLADAIAKSNLGAWQHGTGLEQTAYQFTPRMQQALQMPAQAAQGWGQVTEDYQGRALQDAMQRFAHQYQEPYQRLQNVAQSLGVLQPLGVQRGSGQSAGTSTGTQPNPGYQSPLQQMVGLGSALMGGGGIMGLFG